MLALHPRVVDVMWAAIEPRLPEVVDDHPLGCHRRRVPDRTCFEAILFRLVAGCSWDVAGRLGKGSETTLRRRRTEWLEAGVFDGLVDESLAGYDRIIGLDLSEVAVDGSQHKAPFGGEGTGPNPVDRGKRGWKWSIATAADDWQPGGVLVHESRPPSQDDSERRVHSRRVRSCSSGRVNGGPVGSF